MSRASDLVTGGGGFEIELIGHRRAIAALKCCRGNATVSDLDLVSRSVKVVAGTRNRRSHHATVPI